MKFFGKKIIFERLVIFLSLLMGICILAIGIFQISQSSQEKTEKETLENAPKKIHSGKIAFIREGNIWTINPDKSGEKLLVEVEKGWAASELKWSPDGTKIAYYLHTTDRDNVDVKLQYFDMSSNAVKEIWNSSGKTTTLTYTAKALNNYNKKYVEAIRKSFSWSPASDQIVFIGEGLSIFSLTNGSIKKIASIDQQIKAPVLWTSNDKIFFMRVGSVPELNSVAMMWLLDGDYRFAEIVKENIKVFDVSSDGLKFAYSYWNSNVTISYIYELTQEGKFGKKLGTISENTSFGKGLEDNSVIYDLKYSPDNRKLLILSDLYETMHGPFDIYDLGTKVVLNSPDRIPTHSSDYSYSWSPSSDLLLFTLGGRENENNVVPEPYQILTFGINAELMNKDYYENIFLENASGQDWSLK